MKKTARLVWLKGKDPQMLKKYASVPPGIFPLRDGSNPSPQMTGPGNGAKRSRHSCVDSDNKERPREQQCDTVCSGALFKIARAFSLWRVHEMRCAILKLASERLTGEQRLLSLAIQQTTDWRASDQPPPTASMTKEQKEMPAGAN